MHIDFNGNIGIGGDPLPGMELSVVGDTYSSGQLSTGSSFRAGTYAAIAGAIDPTYRLRVYAGHSRLDGNLYVTSNTGIGGEADSDYRLRVWGGDSRFGGDMHATGNVAFGGAPDNNHRLKVYNGSTYLDGPLQVTAHATTASISATGNISTGQNISANGTITATNVNVNNSLTIDGKGSVRSAGPSSLRIGFSQKTIDMALAGSAIATVTADITEFSGDNDDVRVFVSQVRENNGNTISPSNLNINVMEVDAATDTCILTLRNISAFNGTVKLTVYLTTIAKN